MTKTRCSQNKKKDETGLKFQSLCDELGWSLKGCWEHWTCSASWLERHAVHTARHQGAQGWGRAAGAAVQGLALLYGLGGCHLRQLSPEERLV